MVTLFRPGHVWLLTESVSWRNLFRLIIVAGAQPIWCATNRIERPPSRTPMAWRPLSAYSPNMFACRRMDSPFFCMLFYRKDSLSPRITRLAILTTKQINRTVSAIHRPAQWFEMDWSQITDKRHNRQSKARNGEIHCWAFSCNWNIQKNISVQSSLMVSVYAKYLAGYVTPWSICTSI